MTDAENDASEAFGEERLMRTFLASATRSPQAIVDLLMNEVNRYCDSTAPFDDITLCVVRYRGD
jgi:serine phosphatase RsbU (regulator of sigma subunit)